MSGPPRNEHRQLRRREFAPSSIRVYDQSADLTDLLDSDIAFPGPVRVDLEERLIEADDAGDTHAIVVVWYPLRAGAEIGLRLNRADAEQLIAELRVFYPEKPKCVACGKPADKTDADANALCEQHYAALLAAGEDNWHHARSLIAGRERGEEPS